MERSVKGFNSDLAEVQKCIQKPRQWLSNRLSEFQARAQSEDRPITLQKKKKKITHLQGKAQGKGWLARHRVQDKLARNVGKQGRIHSPFTLLGTPC